MSIQGARSGSGPKSKRPYRRSPHADQTKFDKWLLSMSQSQRPIAVEFLNGDLVEGYVVEVDRYMVRLKIKDYNRPDDLANMHSPSGIRWFSKSEIFSC